MIQSIAWLPQAADFLSRVSRLIGKRCASRLLMAFLAGLIVTPTFGANLMVNGGFESFSASIGERPTAFFSWRGDNVSYVTAQNGITPPEGNRMLRFINADDSGPLASEASQYWQNISLVSVQSLVASGNARLNVSALFNRILGDAQTDTEFDIEVSVRSGTISTFTELDNLRVTILTDGNPTTWQMAAITNYHLPTTTTYLELQVYAEENVFNDTVNPEFDGHYADDVILTVTVPEPASAVLATLGASLVGLGVMVRRGGRPFLDGRQIDR